MLPIKIFVAFLGFIPAFAAAQMRTWTDYKGRTIEAKMIRPKGESVVVRRADGKEFTLERKNLSDGDIVYLDKLAAGGGSAGDDLDFDSFDVDKKSFVERDEPFKIGDVEFPNVVETPHFIVVADEETRRSLPLIYGEVAERLFLEIAQDVPGLIESFNGRKMPIILVESGMHPIFTQALSDYYRELGWYSRVSDLSGWDTMTITGMRFSSEDVKKNKTTKDARVFHTGKNELSSQRKLRWHSRIHFLASTIIREYLTTVNRSDGYSFDLLKLGYVYLKEDEICGRVETKVVYTSNPLTVAGFEDGRTWPSSVKKLLENPDLRPSLSSILETPASGAQPADVGFSYGLSHFMTRDPSRRAQFGKMLEDTIELDKFPQGDAFAEYFGFDSVEAFDNAWIAYMKTDEFE